MATSKAAARRASRERTREEADVQKALGLSKAQWDAMRPKKRRTAADDMNDRLEHTQLDLYRLAVATRTALTYQLGRMVDKAALSDRDRGALELMGVILDEAEKPGTIFQRIATKLEADRSDRT